MRWALRLSLLLGLGCGITTIPEPAPPGPRPRASQASRESRVLEVSVQRPGPKTVYPFDVRHSPINAAVVAQLQAIAALDPKKRGNVFSKVGDSNTVHAAHLGCFAHVEHLGDPLLDATLAHFRAGYVGDSTPFDRTSFAAAIGWRTFAPLEGEPSPLARELEVAAPRYATVMFGTNDVGFADPLRYAQNLVALVDTLVAEGVVPVVSTIPPREDSPTHTAWVEPFNLIARGVAQSRQVPLVDLYGELRALPLHGLRPDRVHLNAFGSGNTRGCGFSPRALEAGHNVRNQLTLEALSRAWTAVSEGKVWDADAPARAGSGVRGDEIPITALPFVDVRDHRLEGAQRPERPGCRVDGDGGEVLYRLELSAPTTLRVLVLPLGENAVEAEVLESPSSGSACVARLGPTLPHTFPAGTTWLSVAASRAQAGEYLLGLIALPKAD